jgi:hypothetical protein
MSFYLLKEYISSILIESAISVSSILNKKFALSINDDADSMSLMLYSPTDLFSSLHFTESEYKNDKNEVESWTDIYPGENDGTIHSSLLSTIGLDAPMSGGYIYAVFHVVKNKNSENWNAWEITNATARSGYGPAMYDIIMSIAGTIMSDRKTVSDSAKKIWFYYLNNRNDVEALPLNNEKKSNNPLDFAYKSKKTIDITMLIANHNSSIKKLASKFKINKDELFDALEVAADEFWKGKMSDH